jgi:hypothetical protein
VFSGGKNAGKFVSPLVLVDIICCTEKAELYVIDPPKEE